MRARAVRDGLRVQAIAGTHTVLLGLDLDAPAGCLGFAIHRTDHTEGESYWLRGLRTFASVAPDPMPGSDYSTAEHPVQGFQWGDYTAKPGHRYTYRISAMQGAPGALTQRARVQVTLTTELEDDGAHGVYFNRGVAGSQAFVKRYGSRTPLGTDETSPAFRWLSRGLAEAFARFCGEALGPDWGLRGAFYEFTWATGLASLRAAVDRGADVRLLVHGRDRGADDTTADQARAAAAAAGLDDPAVTRWRVEANSSALMHHKFLVLTHLGAPVAVWTGSTNLTMGGIYGHSNVGHLIRDPVVAADFLAAWEALASPATTQALRDTHETGNVVPTTVPGPPGVSAVFSPRADETMLQWYGALFDSATESAHVTGAFGLNPVFADPLAIVHPHVMRTVLLDKPNMTIPRNDPMVRISTGAHLSNGRLGQWAQEHLTGFNTHVKYIHTKIVLIDPMRLRPTIITGSANYSRASTVSNEEHTLVIRSGGRRAPATRTAAVRRVADIYLTEYHRLFMHFVFRAWADRVQVNTGDRAGVNYLREDDGWLAPYVESGAWRSQQRLIFSGQPAT